MADLAPRDVVAKTIMRRMRETGASHVWLDGRRLGADMWVHRFPTILAECRMRGIDPVSDLIPVAPAQHYASGGVVTDLEGRSTIGGLYACGEVACSGVHGANRLASNSLLEGLVFARRIAEAIVNDERSTSVDPDELIATTTRESMVVANSLRRPLQQIMDTDSGVLRSETSLAHATQAISAAMVDPNSVGRPCTEDWETTNLHWVAYVVAAHAAVREETRGSHWREDFPESNVDWRFRLVTTIDELGVPQTRKRTPDWMPGGMDA